jgi:predicted dithiol-disulfide oxidoreductase (DUF899 family)
MPDQAHRVGTREEWLAARIALLEQEIKFSGLISGIYRPLR